MKLAIVTSLSLLASLVDPALAQPFPSRPMRMVVPAPPSGSSDIIGRLIAEHLQRRLGQSMITENRPGAGQTIGTAYVAKSDPDGHTLLLITVSYTTNAAVYSKLPYDPLTDLTGVAMVGRGPLLLTVHPSVPVKSVKQLIALAKSRPGQLNFGSAGTGTIPHMAAELFVGSAQIDMVHVPYKGIAPAVTATVAGEVPVLFASTPAAGAMVKANRLRALAVTTAKRSTYMPELPTIAEAGVPGYDVATWWGVLAPAKTPAAVVSRLNDEIRKIVASDDVRARIVADGAEPVLDMTSADFNALLKQDIEKWRRIVKVRNIRVN
ncbi:MAG TPA: tripartite tricarboxylate transporter substrate binding protein [Burkholderiales bacterium]|nr:tripartite tricarboxylate transporter substrate binding protein [Burkholderiales bacterium]